MDANTFKFKDLPAYAGWILDHRLRQFVTLGIRFSREEDLPLLKLLEKFSEEELIGLSEASYLTILGALRDNQIAVHIDTEIRRWISNTLGIVDKHEIDAEDLTLASYIRRKMFRSFLDEYTPDQALIKRLIDEIDVYTTREELLSYKAYLSMQHEKLKRSNHELVVMNRELESFNYIASHDMQEPLRKIQTYTNRLLEDEEPLSSKGKEYVDKTIASATRMQKLIRDLISFSQLSDKTSFEPVDLDALVAEVIQSMSDSVEETKAGIETGKLPSVKGIPFQLTQLFTNLIGNAIKYRQEGLSPRIRISSSLVERPDLQNPQYHDPSYLEVQIADNGIGFDPEQKEKIFQLFTRLHTQNKYSGTGIGLAICKKIMQNHNGYIEAEGAKGEGSTFKILLPVSLLVS